MRSKVNFIGIGAQKAGTSWLASCLSEHPEICMHPKKEAHYFNKRTFYFNRWHYQYSFKNKNKKVIGEITPGYMSDDKVAKRIFQYNKYMKIIAILRDPTDRCISQYKMEMSRGSIEKNSGLWDAFNRDLPKYGPMKYRGLYNLHIKNFEKYFNKSQILILDYENISRKPNDFLQKVFSFLNVDMEFIPKVINKNIKHKKDIRKDIQIANEDILKIREFYSNF